MAEQTGYGRLKTEDFAATDAIDSDTLVPREGHSGGSSFKIYASVNGTAQLFWVDGFGVARAEEDAEAVTANDTLTIVARSFWPKRFVRFTPSSQPGNVIIEGASF